MTQLSNDVFFGDNPDPLLEAQVLYALIKAMDEIRDDPLITELKFSPHLQNFLFRVSKLITISLKGSVHYGNRVHKGEVPRYPGVIDMPGELATGLSAIASLDDTYFGTSYRTDRPTTQVLGQTCAIESGDTEHARARWLGEHHEQISRDLSKTPLLQHDLDRVFEDGMNNYDYSVMIGVPNEYVIGATAVPNLQDPRFKAYHTDDLIQSQAYIPIPQTSPTARATWVAKHYEQISRDIAKTPQLPSLDTNDDRLRRINGLTLHHPRPVRSHYFYEVLSCPLPPPDTCCVHPCPGIASRTT